MALRGFIKGVVSKSLHAVGSTLERINLNQQSSTADKFAPSDEDKSTWLKKLGVRTVRDAGANAGQFAGDIHATLPSAAIYSFELLRDVNLNQQSTAEYKFAPSDEDKSTWLKKLDIRTVLDVGANGGGFAADIHATLPSAAIYSFEPLRDCYAQLVNTMKDVRSFRAFDFALGDETLQTTIHRSSFSPSSSLLPMADVHKQAFPFTNEGWVSESVRMRRLDDVADELNLVDNILIKIDVQGFEDRVIRGGWNTVRRAKLLIVEVSFERLYQGQPLFDEIYDTLREAGFTYRGATGQLLSPIDGAVLQADGIFLKAS
jgi:FkbM family methyltransferase